jgi:pyruvate-formate lyase-activating enzyme
MHVAALGLHITYRCNARCQHCAYHCGPEAKGVMKFSEAKEYLREASKQDIDVLCISGGEPMLYPRLVTQIVEEAGNLKMRSIWLFTNTFWATDQKIAEKNLAKLMKAGMTRLCTSADGFHRPFVSTDSIRNAMIAAHKLNLEVVLDTRYLGITLQEDNPENRATIQVLQQLGDLVNVQDWRGSPLYVGRAAEVLAPKLIDEPYLLGGACTGPWAGGDWKHPTGVDVDSYGEVTLCPGISIGNARKFPLSKILSNYGVKKHPIIRKLSDSGPEGLAEKAQRIGYKRQSNYASACHLCYDLRKFLRSRYPMELAPTSCYEDPC